MTSPRNKGEVLSETAKSELKKMAKEDYFGYNSEISSKYLTKGIECENDSIDLLNIVLISNYTKNNVRKSNNFITGECDIYSPELIIDIKTSFSLDTFPAITEEINLNDYEWQLRGYMMLYDVPKSIIAYCMVDTPEYLIYSDNESLHKVNHIDPLKRVTTIEIERCFEKEKELIEKVEHAQKFYLDYITKLNEK